MHPAKAGVVMDGCARDVPVQIQGVWVRPGEWLYADEGGVVVSSTALNT